MTRRAAAFLACIATCLVLALVPWTVSSDRLRGAVARQIRAHYGVDLSFDGRVTATLLPVPRVKLTSVRLEGRGGAFLAEAGQLSAELRLLPLLLAKVRLAELRVSGATITVAADRSFWRGIADTVRERLASAEAPVERLVVIGSELRWRSPSGTIEPVLTGFAGLVRWPGPNADLDLTVTGRWRGEDVAGTVAGLNPARLSTGAPDAVEIRLATRLVSLTGSGDLTWTDAPGYRGLVALDAPSLAEACAWTGIGLDLRDIRQSASLRGLARLGPDAIEWPQAVLEVGRGRMEGALGLSFAGARPQFRATLAGEDLDLGWLASVADPTRADPPIGDYDVRLSASTLRMGPLRLGDTATSILVGGERLDVSLGRATLAGGSVRGRLSASLAGEGRSIKAQFALDKVDLERLLADLGQVRGVSGLLSAQANLELAGERHPDLAREIRGRVSVSAQDGEIAGVTLGALPPARSETRSISAGTEWRGGRTRYGALALLLDLGGGQAEIVDGTLDTAATRTRLSGRVSLSDGVLAVRSATRPIAPAPDAKERAPLVLDLRGPLGRPAVMAETLPEAAAPR